MKNLFPVIIALLLTTISCSEHKELLLNNGGDKGKVDLEIYTASDLNRLNVTSTHTISTMYKEIVKGDFRGNSLEEILVYNSDSLFLFSNQGELLEEIRLEEIKPATVIAGDIDNDGKDDIIIGGRDDSAVRIKVLNGLFQTLSELSYENIQQAVTKPQFVKDGNVYFISYSGMMMSPKLSGCWRPGQKEPDWMYYTGPVPISLSLHAASGMIVVSNRAYGHEFMKPDTLKYDYPVNLHGDIILSTEGKEIHYGTFGPESADGRIVENGISEVKSHLADLNGDNEPEIVQLQEHMSDLYTGSSQLVIKSGDGNLLHELDGPECTKASLGFYRSKDGPRILLAWERTGEILLLDNKLETIIKKKLEGNYHRTTVQSIGRYTENQNPSIIISDLNRIMILDEKLNTRWESIVTGEIKNIIPYKNEEDKLSLAILTDELHFFHPGEEAAGSLVVQTEPPGHPVSIGEKNFQTPVILNDLPKGPMKITAPEGNTAAADIRLGEISEIIFNIPELRQNKLSRQIPRAWSHDSLITQPPKITLTDWRDLKLIEEFEIPKEYWIIDIGDYKDNANLEYLLINSDTGDSGIMTPENHDISWLHLPVNERLSARHSIGDVDGDNKEDFMIVFRYEPRLIIYRGDGSVIADRYLTNVYGYDSMINIAPFPPYGLECSVLSGYNIYPRMFYGLSLPNLSLKYVIPYASFCNYPAVIDNRIYYGSYTPHNGAKAVMSNGQILEDSNNYLYAHDSPGSILPEQQILPADTPKGLSHVFAIEWNKDFEKELFIVHSADSHYPGRSGVYLLKDDQIEQIYSGLENQQIAEIFKVESSDQHYLYINYMKTNRLDILDENFRLIKTLDNGKDSKYGYLTTLDFNGDGTTDIFTKKGNVLEIINYPHETVHTIHFSENDDQYFGVYLRDMNLDGRYEIVLYGKGMVKIFGYR